MKPAERPRTGPGHFPYSPCADMNGDPFVRRIQRGTFAHRPTPEHTAMLQPEIPVQACAMRRVFCTTNIGAPVGLARAVGAGSRVTSKLRFAR